MLQKIPIIRKKASSKSCLELNSLQKSQWAPMFTYTQSGARGLMVEILYCTKTANYIHFMAQCCEKC